MNGARRLILADTLYARADPAISRLNVNTMAAASGRADFIRKKLANEGGLAPDAIAKYMDTLRRFLCATMTKIRFEEEMATVLPRDKYSVHNSIIRELLHRAQIKCDSLPDVPVIVTTKEKRPIQRHNRATPRASTPSKVEQFLVASSNPSRSLKRKDHAKIDRKPNGTTDSGTPNHGPPKSIAASSVIAAPNITATTAMPNAVAHNINTGTTTSSSTTTLTNAAKQSGDKLLESDVKPSRRLVRDHSNTSKDPSPKRMKRMDSGIGDGNGLLSSHTPNGNAVGGRGAATTTTMRNSLAVPMMEIATYDTLSFQPIQPGQALDIDLFVRMRTRMTRIVERMGLADGVKDEAVALLTHSLETHMKRMLESCVDRRIARECTRPAKYPSCLPVTTYDLREGVAHELSPLGADAGLAIERLSLLL